MSYIPEKTIYLCLAHMSEDGIEQKYVKEAFDTNWVVPLGPNVNAFEEDLKNFVGGQNEVVALSAGTAAVHLALIGCGVQAGDEVLVQSFTFCASSHPITYLGAKPVFVGSEKDTWNMDPILLEEAIKDRIAKTGKKPKAIVPVELMVCLTIAKKSWRLQTNMRFQLLRMPQRDLVANSMVRCWVPLESLVCCHLTATR